ncbi:DUF1684 domain-containing protein [Pedobacter sp. SYP-B3415]|uniref:DUF1684 domain-containing protein n=1 Tax=Pedobacter sp. SYP-B3415 TaxID=2496641 RepID=UPI001F0F8D77|nr:DUF1684 domain-containing protein [Pedobacter sp. SYP-B3415]
MQQTEDHRTAYKQAFLTDSHSPLKKEDLALLRFFPADSSYRVKAVFLPLENPVTFKMPTFDGSSKDFIRYGVLEFSLHGQRQKLVLYKSVSLLNNPIYKDYLFLPFTDQTNGSETYTGGRYIDLSMKDIIGNTIVIDFNKAYNPYCAYSGGYQCPVPPAENNLKINVPAGEKNYAGKKKE